MPKRCSTKKSQQGVGAAVVRWDVKNTKSHSFKLRIHQSNDSDYYPSQANCTQSTVDDAPVRRRRSRRLKNDTSAENNELHQVAPATPPPLANDDLNDDEWRATQTPEEAEELLTDEPYVLGIDDIMIDKSTDIYICIYYLMYLFS